MYPNASPRPLNCARKIEQNKNIPGDVAARFKYVFWRHVNLNRIASICEGDHGVARDVASCALRQFPDDLEGGKEVAVVELDQCLKFR